MPAASAIPPATSPNPASSAGQIAHHVQMEPIGGHVCLFQPDTHGLALLNPSAGNICSALLAGCTVPEIAQQVGKHTGTSLSKTLASVEDITSQLRRNGFLDLQTFPATADIVRPLHINHKQQAPALDQIYGLDDTAHSVRVICRDTTLAGLLEAALAPVRISKRSSNSTIEVTPDNDGFSILRNSAPIASNVDAAHARRICLQALLIECNRPRAISTILHASSVEVSGRTVVLAGATGSGKTTLMMALAGSGANYIADDFTALDDTGLDTRSFPIAASIKSGSIQALSNTFPMLNHCQTFEVGTRQVRYLSPATRKTSTVQSAPIGALVFPRFIEGSEPVVERMSPENALTSLMNTGSEIVGDRRSIKPVATLVNRVPAYRLSYGTLGPAVDRVIATVQPR